MSKKVSIGFIGVGVMGHPIGKHLMAHGYDLLVFVRGGSLQKVAAFVSEKLSTVEGVLSTSTHFMLRCYKEQGFLLDGGDAQSSRLNVAP